MQSSTPFVKAAFDSSYLISAFSSASSRLLMLASEPSASGLPLRASICSCKSWISRSSTSFWTKLYFARIGSIASPSEFFIAVSLWRIASCKTVSVG